jgi:predicted ribosomally synthesized peptide with nif11-like leader
MAELKDLLEKVKSDTALQEKIKSAADKNAVVKAVADAGFNISAEDAEKVIAAVKSGVSSDDIKKAASGLGDKIKKLF